MSGFKLSNASPPVFPLPAQPTTAQADGIGVGIGSSAGPAHPPDHPLGLTVHSLPKPALADAAPANSDAEDALAQQRRTRLGRWKMTAVLLICAAPVIASYVTYYGLRPEGRRNFGQLVSPQRPLPDQVVTALDGSSRNLRSLKGQWLLVVVAAAGCDAVCQNHLYLQRQLQTSLGKDADRLDRVWLVTDAAPLPPGMLPALANATVLRVPPAVLAGWLQAADGQALADHLYLVDPVGNWMLRFPAQLDLSGAARAKRDLERLLRASASWDRAGREP
jgi:hypothetical protein